MQKRWMRVTAHSGANWEEYENLDRGGGLGFQGEESWLYLDPFQEVWVPVPFISKGYTQTRLNYLTLLKDIFPPKFFLFPLESNGMVNI